MGFSYSYISAVSSTKPKKIAQLVSWRRLAFTEDELIAIVIKYFEGNSNRGKQEDFESFIRTTITRTNITSQKWCFGDYFSFCECLFSWAIF